MIRPRVCRCLQTLVGASADHPRLDRAEAERWLETQLGFLGISRQAVWADGPLAAWHALATEPWTDLPRQAGGLAEHAAIATARRFPVRGEWPDLATLTAAAVGAAQYAIESRLAGQLQSAVDEPRLTARMNGVWRNRWLHDRAGKARGSAAADAYLRSRRTDVAETAATTAHRKLSPLPAPAGWSGAWLAGWMAGWAKVGRPAGRRGEAIDEDWAAILDAAGEQAGAVALDKAGTHMRGAVIEHRKLMIYSAWAALGELNAGPPMKDLPAWRRQMRGYWRPFYEQATAGLGWCWFTPDAVVCLPRPTIMRIDGGPCAIWPNGEQIEAPETELLGE